MSSGRFCVHCVHYVPSNHSIEYAKCARTTVLVVNLIDGKTKAQTQYCDTERMYDLERRCGPQGKFFEPAKVAA